jgi:hypothetical protein
LNHPTELDQFLRERRADESCDSGGDFALAVGQVVEKLVQFQLPFRSAWVVKVIQCAVREGAVASIQVELTAREARFSFYTSSFDFNEIKAAFLTPELNANVALRHLVRALWAVGLEEKWPFEISIPNASESLIWDGEAFHLNKASKKNVKTSLVVSLASERDEGWLPGVMRRAEIDAEILRTLQQYCYTSPVPLIVDGRRMDSLQACWGHGWGPESCPMALGFADADVPDLPISPGSFEKKPPSNGEAYSMRDGRRALSLVSPRQVASVPFLLTHHLVAQGTGKNKMWQRQSGQSSIYWVQDGVVVQTEPMLPDKSRLTVGCFVSAEGLDSDLTTLHLRDLAERRQRKELACRAVVAALGEVTVLSESMEELAESRRNKASWSQKIFYLAGFGAFWVSPVAGFLLAGAAYLSGKAPDRDIKARGESYKAEIVELLALFKKSQLS